MKFSKKWDPKTGLFPEWASLPFEDHPYALAAKALRCLENDRRSSSGYE